MEFNLIGKQIYMYLNRNAQGVHVFVRKKLRNTCMCNACSRNNEFSLLESNKIYDTCMLT